MIEIPARIAFLKKIHLFYGLEEEEFTALAEELEERTYAEGEVIFEQESKPNGFYLIHDGTVRVTRMVDGTEVQLALLVNNDYFGEMALVANRRRSATAAAQTKTTLLFLPSEDFDKLYKRAPHIKSNLEVAVRSRVLARKLKFKWLRSDEVVYFLARRHPLVLWQKLVLPFLALVVPAFFLYSRLYIIDFAIVGVASFV